MWNPAGQKSCGAATTMRGEEFALPTAASAIRAAIKVRQSVKSDHSSEMGTNQSDSLRLVKLFIRAHQSFFVPKDLGYTQNYLQC